MKTALLLLCTLIYGLTCYSTHGAMFAQVGCKGSGHITKEEFRKQKSPDSMEWVDINHAEPIPTDSFNVLVIRNNRTILGKPIYCVPLNIKWTN